VQASRSFLASWTCTLRRAFVGQLAQPGVAHRLDRTADGESLLGAACRRKACGRVPTSLEDVIQSSRHGAKAHNEVRMKCFACFSFVMFLTAPCGVGAGARQAHIGYATRAVWMRATGLRIRAPAGRAPRGGRPAQSGGDPQVALQAGYARTNHVQEFGSPGGRLIYPDIPDNVPRAVDFNWPIYTGGARPRSRAAAAEADALDRIATPRAPTEAGNYPRYWAVVTARASSRWQCRARTHRRASRRTSAIN